LADSYGADLQRWPERSRRQALVLLDASSEAQAIIVQARELDEAIASAGAARDARLRGGEGAGAALFRLHEKVSARTRRAASAGAIVGDGFNASAASRYRPQRVGWVGFATAAGLAVVAGLALGIFFSPAAPQQDLTALLQPAPLQGLTD
jgi:hypothetical protein